MFKIYEAQNGYRHPHNQTPTTTQDFTSGFISLPSRPIEMIAEIDAENCKLRPHCLQFPIPISDVSIFLSFNSDRINQF